MSSESPAATEAPTEAAPKLEGEALAAGIRNQVEYYLSQDNLARDKWLVQQMDEEKYVSLELIAGFKLMRTLSSDVKVIAEALRSSKLLVLNDDETKVKSRGKVTRNTIILREISSQADPESVKALFKAENAPELKSLTAEVGDCWFATFADEETAIYALNYLRGQTYNGEPVRARMKSENISRSFYVPPAATSGGAAGSSGSALNPAGAAFVPTFYPGAYAGYGNYYDPAMYPYYAQQQQQQQQQPGQQQAQNGAYQGKGGQWQQYQQWQGNAQQNGQAHHGGQRRHNNRNQSGNKKKKKKKGGSRGGGNNSGGAGGAHDSSNNNGSSSHGKGHSSAPTPKREVKLTPAEFPPLATNKLSKADVLQVIAAAEKSKGSDASMPESLRKLQGSAGLSTTPINAMPVSSAATSASSSTAAKDVVKPSFSKWGAPSAKAAIMAPPTKSAKHGPRKPAAARPAAAPASDKKPAPKSGAAKGRAPQDAASSNARSEKAAAQRKPAGRDGADRRGASASEFKPEKVEQEAKKKSAAQPASQPPRQAQDDTPTGKAASGGEAASGPAADKPKAAAAAAPPAAAAAAAASKPNGSKTWAQVLSSKK